MSLCGVVVPLHMLTYYWPSQSNGGHTDMLVPSMLQAILPIGYPENPALAIFLPLAALRL